MPTVDHVPRNAVRTYRMLGRDVAVEFDESRGADVLERELSLYPQIDAAATPTLKIRYGPVRSAPAARVNPRVHEEYDDGFIARFQTADVRFSVDEEGLSGLDFYIPSSAPLIALARKALDIQFTSREERAGMIFHELALVPAAHWMSDLAVVHASALSAPSGEVTMIGGTGGVGKTSLMLELCLQRGYAFIADDIGFVRDDGWVYPNLAYPKIYAYNLEDNSELARRVLKGRGIADRLQWAASRARGPHYARRRIAPNHLFGAINGKGGPLKRYVVLVREDRSAIDVSTLAPERAASVAATLMPPEYSQFYHHVYWHEYHRLLERREPSITLEGVLRRWTDVLTTVFAEVRCTVVRVPLGMSHQHFKLEMAERLVSDIWADD